MERMDRRSVLGAIGAATVSLAGCSGDTEDDEEQFRIANTGFAIADITSYRDYRPQPDRRHTLGETVHLYFEIRNPETQDGDSFSERFDITEEYTVTDSNGEAIIDETLELENPEHHARDASLEQFYFTNDYVLPEDGATGEYTHEMEVRDELADESDTATETFTVEEPSS